MRRARRDDGRADTGVQGPVATRAGGRRRPGTDLTCVMDCRPCPIEAGTDGFHASQRSRHMKRLLLCLPLVAMIASVAGCRDNPNEALAEREAAQAEATARSGGDTGGSRKGD